MNEKYVHLVLGDDEYARREKVDEIISSILSPDEQKHAVMRYTASELNEDVIGKMKVLPFFTTKQVIVISNIVKGKHKELELLLAYLKQPNSFTYIILEGDRFDGRDSLARSLKERCHIHLLKKDFDTNLGHVIYSYLKKEMRTITPDAAQLLLERVGGSHAFLTAMLNKIVMSTECGGTITEENITHVVEEFLHYDVYSLTNALSAKDAQKSLEILAYLIDHGSKETELIGILGWQMRRLFEAKVLREKGCPVSDIREKLRIYPKFIDQFMRQVRNFTKGELGCIIEELYLIDKKIKQSFSDAQRELEILLVRICCNQFV